jgi:tetratricopeptide (TPR) repeat protein
MKLLTRLIIALIISLVTVSVYAKKKTTGIEKEQLTPQSLKFDYYYLNAVREREAGRFDAALDLLEACRKIKPLDGAVMFELSKIYATTQNADTIAYFLQQAVNADPSNTWYRTALAEQYLSLQKVDKAVNVYNDILKIDPLNETAMMVLISVYSQSGRLNDAVNMLNMLEKQQGMSQDITVEKARLYFMMQQNKKGIAEVDKLIKTYPNELKYQVVRGDIYLEQGMKTEAMACYQAVLNTDPNQGDALYSLSKYYKSAGDTVQMLSTLDQLVKNKNVDVEVKLNVLKDLISQPSDVLRAQNLVNTMLDIYPEEENLHNYKYMFLMSKQKYDQAESELHIMLDLNSQNKMTWMKLLELTMKKENFTASDSLCSKALENFPEDAELLFYKSVTLFQLSKFTDAITVCKKALRFVPESNLVLLSQLYTQMGDTYYRLNDKDSTFLSYDLALKYQPNNVGTLNNYAYYLSLEKRNLQKAESMSAKTVSAEPTNATYLDTYAWVFFVEGNYTLAKIYAKQAIDNGGDKNPEVLEHYGDILYFTTDKDQAPLWWKKALDAGGNSNVLKKKIEDGQYIDK